MKLPLFLKPSNEWNEYELKALNVNIIENDDLTFFDIWTSITGCSNSHNDCVECTSYEGAVSPESIKFLTYLEECKYPRYYSSGDLCSEILKIAHYECKNAIIRTKFKVNWIMCGKSLDTTLDVCIMKQGKIALLVEENIGFEKRYNIDPQILAKSIAVYQYNKATSQDNSKEIPTSLVFPVIVFNGTNPWFYKIKLTDDLVNGIKFGKYSNSIPIDINYFDPKLDTCLKVNDIISRRKLFRYLAIFKDLFNSGFVYKSDWYLRNNS